MRILETIWFYLVVIFPFGICALAGMLAHELAKSYFYDMQKYKLLRELNWINYFESDLKSKIEKSISWAIKGILVCILLLILYHNFAYEISGKAYIFIALSFLYGMVDYEREEKSNTMADFIKEYQLDIQIDELRKDNKTPEHK